MSRVNLTFQTFFNRRVLLAFAIVILLCSLCFALLRYFLEDSLDLAQLLNSSRRSSEDFISNHIKYVSKKDFQKLIDLEDFEFLLNHSPCENFEMQPLVVILIHSAPKGFQKRRVIRETWGKIDPRSLLLFLVGTTNSTETQKKIDDEFKVSFCYLFQFFSSCNICFRITTI